MGNTRMQEFSLKGLQWYIQHLDLSKNRACGRAASVKLCPEGLGSEMFVGTSTLRDPESEPPPKRLKPSEPRAESGNQLIVPAPVWDLCSAWGGRCAANHRCEWRHFVGQQFFCKEDLGAAEFSAICRMSSWATCGLRAANQDSSSQHFDQSGKREEHETRRRKRTLFLSAAEREKIGHLCKRLIDSGRCDFLKSRGFSSRLTCYTDRQVTLENVLLTAVPVTLFHVLQLMFRQRKLLIFCSEV
ncbi:tRNA:m(4)X modification enzyme TRM13-like [Oryzias melastigma]|uniref:tRNA:m(4)X modification enzyme TRM13 n=1 Tax=Oryzias melastigma TaxID=30732 RepID=A0A834F2Q3_ORYME|nr:tRNA:m(4)X modification enzyme TRM13-like [Oryzias melastigma]